MKMKPLIMSLLLALSVPMRMLLSVPDPYTNTVSSYCGNGSEYMNGSAFQRNLNEVLQRLVTDIYYSAFDFSSFGDVGFNSAVYGLVQCREDLGPSDRQRCVTTAKTRLLQGCSGTYGYIQLNGCLLRYDHHSFNYYRSIERPGTFMWSYCGKNESTNGIVFQQSLNKVLESLVENANPTGFNICSVAEGSNNNSAICGIVQCRGDLGSSACKQCASTAKEIIVDQCYNTSGVIHLDDCFLRYGNNGLYHYLESMQITPSEVLCNSGKSSQPQVFQKTVKVLLSNIITEALRTPKFFAANFVGVPSNLTGHIYGLAQCWGHLSQTNCRSCLTSALEYIFLCQSGALGAQIARDRCHLRYEVFEFFNTSVLSSTPQSESPRLPESKNGSNLLTRKGPPASSIFFHISCND